MKSFLVLSTVVIGLFIEINLVSMWQADRDFAYGKNLDTVSHYVEAYSYLKKAVDGNPNEPTFRDELSYNEAVLATAIYQQATGSAETKLAASVAPYNASAQTLIDSAIADSNKVVDDESFAMPFWKTRTRVFYTLSTIDPKYNLDALAAITRAAQLAPTDAKVHYNLGIIFGRTGQIDRAIKTFEETIKLKPDYRDAYYALALYYEQTTNHELARQTMQTILTKIGPDAEAKKWLDEHK